MIEDKSTYAYQLRHLANPSFDKIRNLAKDFILKLSEQLKDELYEEIERGEKQLETEPELMYYLYAFGKMHKAKLDYAFEHLPESFFEIPELNIIDYGCGQAMATMCYADFLREHGYEQKIRRVTLIEPSEAALKRAALHVSVFFPDAETVTINKGFDDLESKDIVCDEDIPTLHLLSNVLDMEYNCNNETQFAFNLDIFIQNVKSFLGLSNLFVCVGPYFGKDSDRSKRMDDFANNLMEGIIYTVDLNSFELDPNYSWTCMVRCFGVGNLGIALHKEKAGTVNSNVKPSFTNFLTYKGMRRVFIGLKEIVNSETGQKESWQELILGQSQDDPNAEIIRISSKLGTINANFLILNKDKLQVASHPDWKYKRLCIEDRPESTLRENLSTEVTIKDIENGIEDKFGVVYSKDGKRLVSAENCDCKTYTINKGIKVICDRAFFCCKSLQSIVIPNSVTSIGHSAFQDCASLQSIVIPESVTSIGNHAFKSCESLQSIAIPNSVTSIGDSTFWGCDSLQSIVIPNSVTSIGNSAFSYCVSLQSIVIPNSVTSIGHSAFLDCASLQSIVIPKGVSSIGDSAFFGCKSLQSIVIPDNVKSIGLNPFGNSGIHSIVSHSIFFKVDGKALYDQNKKMLIAFYSNDTHFVIPNSVTNIGDSAFFGCESLDSIVIPDSVTNIGDSAFFGCKSLGSIVIPNSVTNIGNRAFRGCTYLQSIVIPDSVTSIGDNTFSYCLSLQSIVIPNSVTSIGDSTFYECSYLQSIVIPNSVKSIGNSAFSYCKSLQSIVIPNSVTSIGDGAFFGCESLDSIVIPDSVTNIGANPFDNSVISSIVSHSIFFKVDGKALYDQNKKMLIAFYSNDTHFVIPDSVTSIGECAFFCCRSLQSIVIQDSVTSIGDNAFSYCESLQSIVIPDNVTKIGDLTFRACHSLQSIVIPESVTNIGDSAFLFCDSLRAIIIPKGSRKKFEKLLPDDIDKLVEQNSILKEKNSDFDIYSQAFPDDLPF